MVVVQTYTGSNEPKGAPPAGFLFWCPGCKCIHPVRVRRLPGEEKAPCWQWNGSVEKPTVSPSLLVFETEYGPRCHSFIRDGVIEFCADSGHELKGQNVLMGPWRGWDNDEDLK